MLWRASRRALKLLAPSLRTGRSNRECREHDQGTKAAAELPSSWCQEPAQVHRAQMKSEPLLRQVKAKSLQLPPLDKCETIASALQDKGQGGRRIALWHCWEQQREATNRQLPNVESTSPKHRRSHCSTDGLGASGDCDNKQWHKIEDKRSGADRVTQQTKDAIVGPIPSPAVPRLGRAWAQ